MNNSKIWLVVKPTVGVPIFLGAVAVGSFAVHVAVLTNTSWVDDFLQGKELGSSSAALETEQTILPVRADVTGGTMYLDASAPAHDGMTVILPDGRAARLVVEEGA